jgi:hypothetical protein
MDAKVTLSFNKSVIEKAKKYAESQNMSLSRLLEVLLDKITSRQYRSLEEFPISDWVHEISEGNPEYHSTTKSRSKIKDEFRARKKK